MGGADPGHCDHMDAVWLELEKGVSRGLRLRRGIDIVPPHHDQAGRRALVLQAAHTVLPEASVVDLPAIARVEVEARLTGPLREAIAAADRNDESLLSLRDRLVVQLGERPGLEAHSHLPTIST